jgi:hypothetical protein
VGRIAIGKAWYACPMDGRAFECASTWLGGPGPARGLYALQAEAGRVSLPRVAADSPPPRPPHESVSMGAVERERREADSWFADVVLHTDGLVVLRESFHPKWQVEVDGRPAETLRVAPGFVAAAVPAGRHQVAFLWEPGLLKSILLSIGLLGVGAAALWEGFGRPNL